MRSLKMVVIFKMSESLERKEEEEEKRGEEKKRRNR
jgi:hypothetical protein